MFIISESRTFELFCGSFDLRKAFTAILKRTKLLIPKYPTIIEYKRKIERR